MITFKLNGKQVSIPSSWDDVTMRQYLEIIKIKDDFLKLVSICSGADYEILKKATISGLEDVIQAVSFVRLPPILPENVTEIGGYKIPVNNKGGFNIQFESLAQFEDMRKIMMAGNSDSEKLTEDFVKYVAIYLQKIRDGEYDYDKAEMMRDEVLNMPALKVIALGGFFLGRLLILSTGTAAFYPLTNQSQKKSKPVTKGSQKRSARSAQSSKRRSC
jgi:hypothetical protein